ncbi:hypothetical protein RQP46_006137 [Phenoliferia psychrophenolica]
MATLPSLPSELLAHICDLATANDGFEREQRFRFSFGLIARTCYLATANATTFVVTSDRQSKALTVKLEREKERVAQAERKTSGRTTRSALVAPRVSNVVRLHCVYETKSSEKILARLIRSTPHLVGLTIDLQGAKLKVILTALPQLEVALGGLSELRELFLGGDFQVQTIYGPFVANLVHFAWTPNGSYLTVGVRDAVIAFVGAMTNLQTISLSTWVLVSLDVNRRHTLGQDTPVDPSFLATLATLPFLQTVHIPARVGTMDEELVISFIREAPTMAPPQLPPELVADIIELTVELLIEEERHLEAHAPLSNRFLRSAALVNRTWHSIAVEVLLKRGIVTSGSVVGFLAQVKAHGMEETLESVRFGEATSGVTEEDAAKEDVAFDFLVRSPSGLTSIELVESGAHFQTALPTGRSIRQVHLSNFDLLGGGFGRKFGSSPPTHLVVTETRPSINLGDLGALTEAALGAFQSICFGLESLTITTNQPSNPLWTVLLTLIGNRPESRLRTCRFECTSQPAYRQAIKVLTHKKNTPYSFPQLQHFACHLTAAFQLLAFGTQRNLTSLEVLPNLEGEPATPQDKEIQRVGTALILVTLICELPTLENLRMPASWASEEVRKVCNVRGITSHVLPVLTNLKVPRAGRVMRCERLVKRVATDTDHRKTHRTVSVSVRCLLGALALLLAVQSLLGLYTSSSLKDCIKQHKTQSHTIDSLRSELAESARLRAVDVAQTHETLGHEISMLRKTLIEVSKRDEHIQKVLGISQADLQRRSELEVLDVEKGPATGASWHVYSYETPYRFGYTSKARIFPSLPIHSIKVKFDSLKPTEIDHQTLSLDPKSRLSVVGFTKVGAGINVTFSAGDVSSGDSSYEAEVFFIESIA